MKYDIHCKHCKRFITYTDNSVDIPLKCAGSGCKKIERYSITFISDYLKSH